jgi:transcriptional regulator with XRE-family HTH domain
MAATMDELRFQFGKNLKRCRRLAGVSQDDLSKLAGLHRTEIGLL